MISDRFDATSTAKQVLVGVDLRGRRAVVTGGASGIGVETARGLVGAGVQVTIAVRDLDAGQRVAADIAATERGESVRVASLDLADIANVDQFVSSWTGPLDILVNNAGVMGPPLTRNADGWELQFAVNHLGHFALATGLHDALKNAGDARIVVLSSSGHGAAGVDLDDLFFEHRPYDAGIAYGQSKTANVQFAVEARRRWGADGIITTAVMPGGIWTRLQRHWDPQLLAAMQRAHRTKTPEQGAATSVLLATSTALTLDGPVYWEDCHPAQIVSVIPDGLHGVLPHALDSHAADALWDRSLQLLDEARKRRADPKT